MNFERAATPTMLTRSSSLHRTVLHDGFESVRPLWLALQDHGQLTPYQRYGWAQAWMETIGATLGVTPLIVEVTRHVSPVALLPLGIVQRTGCRTAIFLGDRHNNYNMPILARADDGPSTAEWDEILSDVARQAGIDIFEFANQPISWRGHSNALAQLKSAPAASPSFVTDLNPDFEVVLQQRRSKKAESKLRRLAVKLEQSLGPVKLATASSEAEAKTILHAVESFRRDRAATAGIPNFFDTDGARSFLNKAAAEGELRLDYLTAGDTIVAAYVGVAHDGRYSSFMNSFLGRPDLNTLSIGKQVLHQLIARLCATGFTSFDLGVGSDAYKLAWCDADPLTNAIIPVSKKGSVRAVGMRSVATAKRRIKNSPALWALWKRVRPRARQSAEPVED